MGAFVNLVYEYANYIILAGMLLQMIIILQVLVKVNRTGRRLQMIQGKVEDYLMKHIPAEDIPNAHHWILLHGRYICKSTKPLCDKCFFNEYCPKLLKDSKL